MYLFSLHDDELKEGFVCQAEKNLKINSDIKVKRYKFN